MAILPDWYTFNMYWTGHIPVQQNQHIETLFGCKGLYWSVYWSLKSINVLGQNKSHCVGYTSFDIYEDYFCTTIKWLHLNRWCHLSTFCFGDIISIGDIYYLFKLILKYSIIRWMVSHIGNSDIIS